MIMSDSIPTPLTFYAPIPPSSLPDEICRWKTKLNSAINPGRRLGHNLDRNGADDGPDASGASDIRRRDDNSGDSRPRRSSKVCLAGIRG